jgi:dihydroorotase
VEKLSSGPRKILNIELPNIIENAPANLCVFDPDIEWVLNAQTNQSKSKNNPYFGNKLIGKVICTMNKNKTFFSK